jgi:hypothetical protein
LPLSSSSTGAGTYLPDPDLNQSECGVTTGVWVVVTSVNTIYVHKDHIFVYFSVTRSQVETPLIKMATVSYHGLLFTSLLSPSLSRLWSHWFVYMNHICIRLWLVSRITSG